MSLAIAYPAEEVESPLNESQVCQPWQINPCRLINWWDMEKFSAHIFVSIGRLLERVCKFYASQPQNAVDADATSGINTFLDEIEERIAEIGLHFSLVQVQRTRVSVANGTNHQTVSTLLNELEARIRDEMRTNLFLFVPQSRAGFYAKPESFGQDVNKRFPSIQFDLVESGNCFAVGRATACVFHLMRIMEVGVQEFGKKLGVSFADEKNWQNILDEINKAIKSLPKSPHTVEMSQVSANLYAVKVAWRNEVMHPKDTYTLEEAENLIRQVKIFMEQLAAIA